MRKACVPWHKVVFLDLVLDSNVHHSPVSEQGGHNEILLMLFRLHRFIPFRLCLRLLRLMASTILVVPLSHLLIRDFQHWEAMLRLRVTVTTECIAALHP